jgi:hypothetical protein
LLLIIVAYVRCTYNANAKEYLKCHDISYLPFNKIGVDIAEYGGKIFLIVIDYYSKWPECVELKCKTSTEVINVLKRVFSTHGIPSKVIGDNNPFGSFQFKQFALDWNFEVINSSPLYPRSNGQVEKTVQTVKKLIKKCNEDHKDIETALLELRNTPVISDFSPAQILMSRRLRSKIPVSAKLLRPQVCEKDVVNKAILEKQMLSSKYYNRNSRPRRSFKINDYVFVYNVRSCVWEPGRVIGYAPTPSSYFVKLDLRGSILQRNAYHLRLRPNSSCTSVCRPNSNCNKWSSPIRHCTPNAITPMQNQTVAYQPNTVSPSPTNVPIPNSPNTTKPSNTERPTPSHFPNTDIPALTSMPDSDNHISLPNAQETPINRQYKTRFGRLVRKPSKMSDYCV